MANVITVNVLKMISDAFKNVSKDEARRVIEHVNVIVKDGLMTIEATNGYSLARIEQQVSCDDDFQLLIHRNHKPLIDSVIKAAKASVKGTKSVASVAFKVSSTEFDIVYSGGEVTIPLSRFEYPKTKAILDKGLMLAANKYRVKFDFELLKSLFESLPSGERKGHVEFFFNPENPMSPIGLKVNEGAYGCLMPVRL